MSPVPPRLGADERPSIACAQGSTHSATLITCTAYVGAGVPPSVRAPRCVGCRPYAYSGCDIAAT
eukprot:2307846-Pyramimonas_sp.AAC.1